MPFGLKGAPAMFQRLMDAVLRGLQDFSVAYIDDLPIFSNAWEEHLQPVRTVLQRLREQPASRLREAGCHGSLSLAVRKFLQQHSIDEPSLFSRFRTLHAPLIYTGVNNTRQVQCMIEFKDPLQHLNKFIVDTS